MSCVTLNGVPGVKMNFDKNLRGLINVCKEVIKAETSMSLLGNQDDAPSVIMKYCNRYEHSFEYGPLDVHKNFVLDLYTRFKNMILGSLTSDGKSDFSWVDQNPVVLVLGAGTEKPSKNAKVMLSLFYRRAVKLAERIEKDLEGAPDSAWENRQELNYPDVIMLYLHRLFFEVCPDDDKSTLDFIVKYIEKELGLGTGKTEPNILGNGMTGIVSLASNMMKKIGVAVPPDSKMPADSDINNVFNSIFGNPKIQETFQTMFKSLGTSKDLGSAINNITNSLKDGSINSIMNEVVDTMGENGLDLRKMVQGSSVSSVMTSTMVSATASTMVPGMTIPNNDNGSISLSGSSTLATVIPGRQASLTISNATSSMEDFPVTSDK